MHLILIGAPGSGKGTQAKEIVKKFGFYQFSTGDALREAVASSTEYGNLAQNYIKKGELVPDEIIFSIVKDKLERLKDQKGIIYDGFPRNLQQAKKLDEILKFENQEIGKVLYLKIDDKLLADRVTGRRISIKSGKEYHITFNPPKVSGKCDVDQSDLIQRSDDTEEKVKIRIKIFKENTIPLLDYYSRKVVELDASKSISEVLNKISDILGNK